MGMGSVPGTPTAGYAMSGGMGMGLGMNMGMGMNVNINMGMGMGMGMPAHEPQMHMNVLDMGGPSMNNANNTNHATGAAPQVDQSAAFNLCRRRVVAPGIEGQSSAFAAMVDPELAGIAVRVANPQPLVLPNGFLWEFEVCST